MASLGRLHDGDEGTRDTHERVRRNQGDRRGTGRQPRHRGSASSWRSSSAARRRCSRRACTRSPTPATRACCCSAARRPSARPPRSTPSATAASATSTPSSSPSSSSPSVACSRIYEGYEKIKHPHEIEDWYWPVGVLVFAIIAESLLLPHGDQGVQPGPRHADLDAVRPPRQGARAAGRPAGGPRRAGRSGPRARRRRPALATGDGVWDGIGTLCIGVLLIVIAIVLAAETKSLLLGEAAGPEDVEKIRAAIVDGDDRHAASSTCAPSTSARRSCWSPRRSPCEHDDTAGEVASAINAAEDRIREAVPIARVIYLEPDIYRPGGTGSASGADPDSASGSGSGPASGAGKS